MLICPVGERDLSRCSDLHHTWLWRQPSWSHTSSTGGWTDWTWMTCLPSNMDIWTRTRASWRQMSILWSGSVKAFGTRVILPSTSEGFYRYKLVIETCEQISLQDKEEGGDRDILAGFDNYLGVIMSPPVESDSWSYGDFTRWAIWRLHHFHVGHRDFLLSAQGRSSLIK